MTGHDFSDPNMPYFMIGLTHKDFQQLAGFHIDKTFYRTSDMRVDDKKFAIHLEKWKSDRSYLEGILGHR